MNKIMIYAMVLATVLMCKTGFAETPGMINYQGFLTDNSGYPKNGTYPIRFTIYDDSTGGNALWVETHPSVAVTKGLFNILLGSINVLDAALFDDTTRYLGIKVDTDPELSSRSRLVTIPYAFRTATIDGARGGDISGNTSIGGSLSISGKAGIGTTTPESKLDVSSINTSTDYRIARFSSDPGSNKYNFIEVGKTESVEGAKFGYLHNTEDSMSGAFMGESPFSGLFVRNGGNVGIMTTVPDKKLRVNGNVRLDGFRMPSGAQNGFVLTSDADGAGTWQQAPIVPDGDWTVSADDIFSKVSGNVGIGTTQPATKLHVNGNTSSRYFYIRHDDTVATLGYGLRWLAVRGIGNTDKHGAVFVGDNGTPLSLILRTRTSDASTAISIQKKNSIEPPIAYFRSDGRVGLGTSSPAAKLDVAGDMRSYGFKMPVGAADGYVLTSDAEGLARWNPVISAGGDITAVYAEDGLTGGQETGDVTISIRDGGVTYEKLASDAVDSTKVADGSITGEDIKDGSISSICFDFFGITTDDIKDGSIAEIDLAPGAVGETHIVDNAIDSDKIKDRAISGFQLYPGIVETGHIVDNSILHEHLASNSVGSSEIQNNTVGPENISDESITADDLDENSIGALHLKTGFITGEYFAANSIDDVDIKDVPGVAQAINGDSIEVTGINTGAPTVLLSCDIDCPADGYVLAMVSATAGLERDWIYDAQCTFYLSKIYTSPLEYTKTVEIPNDMPDGYYKQFVSIQRVFQVNAGTATINFSGIRTQSGPSTRHWATNMTLSLIYFPTDYTPSL